MKRPVAVVGVGQTKHSARRSDVNIPGLVREAVDRALLDAGLEHKDIDAVVIGKAPDMLEGVMQPEQFLVGAIGGHMKPVVRIHTAGSVGATTALAAVTHVASGLFRPRADHRLREAVGRQRHVGAVAQHAVHAAAGRRRRRLLRPVRARLHRPHRRAAAHRTGDRRQRARQRRAQRVRPSARADDGRGRAQLTRPVGPDPLRRDLPVVRRRRRHGHRQRVGREEGPAQAGLGEGGRLVRRSDVGAGPATRSTPPPAAPAPSTSTIRPGSPIRGTRSTPRKSTSRSRGSKPCGWKTSASATSAKAGR